MNLKFIINVIALLLLIIIGANVEKTFEVSDIEKFQTHGFTHFSYPSHGIIIKSFEDLLEFNETYSANLDINKYDQNFFIKKSLVLIQFSHAESDGFYLLDSGIQDTLTIKNRNLIVTIDLKVEENLRTHDITVDSYAITVPKPLVSDIQIIRISINNLNNPNSNKSSYYW